MGGGVGFSHPFRALSISLGKIPRVALVPRWPWALLCRPSFQGFGLLGLTSSWSRAFSAPQMNFLNSIHAMQSYRSEATGRGAMWFGVDVRHLAINWTKTPVGVGRCEEPLRRHRF